MTYPDRPRRSVRRRTKRPLSVRVGFVALMTFAGAGIYYTANIASDLVEARAVADVGDALKAAGHDWAQVNASGLRVLLSGTAPSEVDRMRAVVAAATAVQPARINDQMLVASTASLPPPPFAVELLANDAGISLIGLVPAKTDRKATIEQLGKTGAAQISDLLTTADHAPPEGWNAAFDFGLQAVAIAPRAKISIEAGKLTIAAIADSTQDKVRIEQTLQGIRPVSVALVMDIKAPLPVISPFMLRYVLDADGARFEACSAANEADRTLILDAGNSSTDCRLGLGAPSDDWATVSAKSIEAVTELGQGSVNISNFSITLQAHDSVSQESFDKITGRLESGLPAPFRLAAFRDAPAGEAAPAIEFNADKALASAPVTLGGRITNEQMREAVESLARARLGDIRSDLLTDDATPSGWTVRVAAGIEAMSALTSGKVSVTPEQIRVEGVSGDKHAGDHIAAMLASRLGDGAHYSIKIAYDRRQDTELALPDGDTCVARLNAVLDEAEISFAPSSASFAEDITDTVEALGSAMADCEVYRIEIGGHTDSQGSDGFNQKLSENRAKAVLTAMQDAGIDVTHITAHGYGESQPIATNETEAGREQNRRIEMHLVSPEPVIAEPLPPADLVTGVTTAEEAEVATDPTPEAVPAAPPSLPIDNEPTAPEAMTDEPVEDNTDDGLAEVPTQVPDGYRLNGAGDILPDRPAQRPSE